MICLKEAEREREKKNGERGMRFVPHDEQRTASSFSFSFPNACRSFVDRVLHRIAANIHLHCANLGECKTSARQVGKKANRCLSCINSVRLGRETFSSSPLCHNCPRKQEITCLPCACARTSCFHPRHARTASYAIRFVTHTISHACRNSLLPQFDSSSSVLILLLLIRVGR